MAIKLDKRWQPREHEDALYRLWEKQKTFSPKRGRKQQPFTIIMPPPNANGSLHIGHAMFVTLEDILVRFQRMRGKATLMLPGADHAGILTQVVFERELAKKGKTRFDLGRETFYRACFAFSQKNKQVMYNQIKKLGASCDWSREKFTLDKDISREVVRTFIQLHQDQLVYRAERLINWCPRCMTALSDLEVEYHEVDGQLYFIKYPLVTHSKITGEQRFIIVATTRPETMLGDTAVAVHPDDKRYQAFVGQKISLPLTNRQVPVIADRQVDPEFGTGAVKVTPAHDPVDFAIGQRHHLESISVIGFDNQMTQAAGTFAGLSAKKARQEMIAALQKKDYLISHKRHVHQVGHCERCKTVIEPQLSLQWFVSMKPLAKPAIQAVKSKKIAFIPKRFTKQYFQWLENIQDWCVSRQLWWGQRLPVYYCGSNGLSQLQRSMNPSLVNKAKTGCGHVMVAVTKPKQCPQCGKKAPLIQDPDTFDTWFSSGQWPYLTLGYPKSRDYQYFYPTSVMETGYEILFFWVARMIMLGLYRTGKAPFKAVYLHGLVRDAFGEKMSKSKGNVINPLGVIEQFGADALRMALVVGAAPGNDISLGEPKIVGYRNFANKVWNIARFVLGQLPQKASSFPAYQATMKGLTKEDKQIIGRLNQTVRQATHYLETYKFSPAGELIYQFIWHELADRYIEAVKDRLRSGDKAALAVLGHVFVNSLKLLHPFMPFLTEAVWQKLPRKSPEPLIISPWPSR
jgi:valyl-tRNA synthetase